MPQPGGRNTLAHRFRQRRDRSCSPLKPRASGAGPLPALATLREPEAVPPALLQLASHFPAKPRAGVERLSGVAGRALGGADADPIWNWLRSSQDNIRAVQRALLQDFCSLRSKDLLYHLSALLEPPFDALRKRAESLRALEDKDLLLWDAAPAGSREWVELLLLDAIVQLAYKHFVPAQDRIAAANPATCACPRCERAVSSAPSQVWVSPLPARARSLRAPLSRTPAAASPQPPHRGAGEEMAGRAARRRGSGCGARTARGGEGGGGG